MRLSPIGWALRPLKNYAKFSGRASRAELWWFFLFLFLTYIAAWFFFFGAVASSIAVSQSEPSAGLLGGIGLLGIVFAIIWLALIIPSIAVQVRRLHDTDRSGWWLGGFYLLYVIYFVLMFGVLRPALKAGAAGEGAPPSSTVTAGIMLIAVALLVYMVALLVLYCLRGTHGPNRFGDDPYGANIEEVFA